MPKLIFRGASIRFVDLRYDEKSKTTYTKLNFTAAFSDPVREAMEWGEPPAGLSSGDLDGEMNATHFILTPNGSELKKHEMQLDAKTIGSFRFVRLDNGDILRFQIITSVDGAAALAEQYLRTIGVGEAQLRVNYEQQSELDIESSPNLDAVASAVDKVFSDPVAPLAKGTGEKAPEESYEEGRARVKREQAESKGAPLASVTTMGGSHQKKGRK